MSWEDLCRRRGGEDVPGEVHRRDKGAGVDVHGAGKAGRELTFRYVQWIGHIENTDGLPLQVFDKQGLQQ